MIKPGNWKLILLADHSAKMRTFKISRRTIVLVSLAFIFFAGGTFYLSSLTLAHFLTTIAMADVQVENAELRQRLGTLGKKFEDVHLRLADLARSDDQLRLLADIPRIDSDVRQVGVGGLGGSEAALAQEDELVRRLILDMGKMDREIKLQQSSFVEIKDQFESKKDLIAHTPSIRPVEGGYFSSGFGKRRDPFNGRWEIHSGLDISVGRGTPVCATADGEVVFAKRTPGLGNLVIVDHGYGFTTAYGHMSRFNVGLGARVTRGQKIGEVGNTGRSTAPHLHYQVSVMDNAVDPRDYIFEPNAIEYARR